jgi:hypothetical protein
VKNFFALIGIVCIVIGIGYTGYHYATLPVVIDDKLSSIVEKDPLMVEVVKRFTMYDTVSGCHKMADTCNRNPKAHELTGILKMRDAIFHYHKCDSPEKWSLSRDGLSHKIACKSK